MNRVRSWIRSSRAPFVIGAAALLLAGVHGVRTARAWTEGRALSARLRSVQSPAASPGASDAQASPGLSFPAESRPGPALEDLLRLLDDAGIDTYRYRILPSVTGGTEAGAQDSERPVEWAPVLAESDPGSPPLFEEDWEGLQQQVDQVFAEVQMLRPPAETQEWRMLLQVRSSYAALIALLRALDRDERIWTVPVVRARDAGGGIRADLAVTTYARAPEGPAGDTAIPAAIPAGAPRDPFHGAAAPVRIAPGAPRPVSALPQLGAVRSGAGAAAWLDGRMVHRGERAGSWTLYEVRADEVVLRHDDGSIRSIALPKR